MRTAHSNKDLAVLNEILLSSRVECAELSKIGNTNARALVLIQQHIVNLQAAILMMENQEKLSHSLYKQP